MSEAQERERELVELWRDETIRFAAINDLPDPTDEHLHEIITTGIERKAGLAGLLGLNPDNQYRLLFEVAETEEEAQGRLRPLVDFLHYLSDTDGVEIRLTENRYSVDGGKNWKRITKEVVKQAPLLLNGDDSELSTSKGLAKGSLQRLIDYHALELASLGTRLGELICAKRQTGCVSANWLDFIAASYRCSYNSCYKPVRPNGAVNHFSGCLANWLDGYTLITYLVDTQDVSQPWPSRKTARAWLQADASGHPAFLWGREYGSWNTQTAKLVREKVLQPLRELYGIDSPRWIKVEHGGVVYQWSKLSNYGYPGYHDQDNWSGYVLRGLPKRVLWHWASSICWSCGCETDYSKGGVCEDCADVGNEYYCEACERGLDDDSTWSDESGNIYCHACYSERYSSCHHCGDEIYRDDAAVVDDEYVCDRCLERRYTRCEDCDEYYYNDDVTETAHNGYVCEDCLQNYFRCWDCGSWYPLDDSNVLNSHNLCDNCYADATEELEEVVNG